MIDDNELFFRLHPDPETSRRGLAMCRALEIFRHQILVIEPALQEESAPPAASPQKSAAGVPPDRLEEGLDRERYAIITQSLRAHKGVITHAAIDCKITSDTMRSFMARHKLHEWRNQLRRGQDSPPPPYETPETKAPAWGP